MTSQARARWPEAFVSIPARRYSRGATLFAQGDDPSGLFLIDEGCVKLTRNAAGGYLVVGLRTAGWLLGLSTAIAGLHYCVTAETATPCVIREIAVSEFDRFRAREPTIGHWVDLALSEEVLEQVLLIGALGTLDHRRRIEWLLRRLVRNGHAWEVSGGMIQLAVPVSQGDLAQMVAMPASTFSRHIKAMVDDGAVVRQRGRILMPRDGVILGAMLGRPAD